METEGSFGSLLRWAADHGISDSIDQHTSRSCLGRSLCVSFFPDSGGRGLAAVRQLNKGELILRAPKSVLLTTQSLSLEDEKLAMALKIFPSLSSTQSSGSRTQGSTSRSQESQSQTRGGGSRNDSSPSPSPPFPSMPFNVTLPTEFSNVFMNMAANATNTFHGQHPEGGEENQNQSRNGWGDQNMDGNFSFSIGDGMTQDLNGALRSMMQMFTGSAPSGNPQEDHFDGRPPQG